MLTLQDICISYPGLTAAEQVSFNLQEGQIACLLGPSGCGKTSILRAIAGFEPVAQGHIQLRKELVSRPGYHLAAEKRQVGMVFQDFALFPHLTVGQNLAFGLHRMNAKSKQARVEEMLALVGLDELERRYPYQLSGGQQQRVALARALAPKPDLLLLDEPFSSLDTELREELAKEIRQILKAAKATALMVTHDQHEAFAMADIIGVMAKGRLHQWDTAYRLYHQPATPFVADFIGSGVFLRGYINQKNQLQTSLGCFPLDAQTSLQPDQPVKLLVRPDDILHDDDSDTLAEVVARRFRGAHILYELRLESGGGESVLCLAPSHHDHQIGEKIGIRLDLAHQIIFPLDGNLES